MTWTGEAIPAILVASMVMLRLVSYRVSILCSQVTHTLNQDGTRSGDIPELCASKLTSASIHCLLQQECIRISLSLCLSAPPYLCLWLSHTFGILILSLITPRRPSRRPVWIWSRCWTNIRKPQRLGKLRRPTKSSAIYSNLQQIKIPLLPHACASASAACMKEKRYSRPNLYFLKAALNW